MQTNSPDLWLDKLPVPGNIDHKYTRGHAVIYGGSKMTGAARLAAEACARAGAGLCTVVSEQESADIYRTSLPAHILVEDWSGSFSDHFKDKRRTAALLGPGAGGGVKDTVLEALQWQKPCILDADALTCFQDGPGELFDALHKNCVLLPHEGEFTAIFPDVTGSREEKVKTAVERTGACILLKGAETLIGAPDGRMVQNTHASPYLATAGSGDVLAGLITGLIAQGMPVFEAVCAGCWMHGEAALRFGPGLVASDIQWQIPGIMADLIKNLGRA